MTPALLGLIGLGLAHPVPALLSRATWPHRAPRAAIVLWQSLAAAAILAVVGAGLSTALWLVTPGEPGPWRIAVHFAVLFLTTFVLLRLAWSVWTVARETRTRRRRHRALVDLLAAADGVEPGVRILAEQTPVAYCLPAGRKSRVVVSRGALDALDADELRAVLAHERAHVRSRHDLVLEAFIALHRAFPRGPRGDAPLRQSQLLVELLADDAARAERGPVPLASALLKLIGQPTPAGALGAGAATTAAVRLERLSESSATHRGAAALAYTIAVVVLVVPTVSLAVPWILDAWRTLSQV